MSHLERLQLAMEAAGMGFFEVRPGQPPDWSPEALEVFGVKPGEPWNHEFLLQMIPEEYRDLVADAATRVWDPANPDDDFWMELPIHHPIGEVRWVMARGRVHFTGEGPERCAERMIGVVSDVTMQVRAREALAEASRQKDRFLAMLGHELRNPLAAIRHAVELLERAGDDRARRERAQAASAGGDRSTGGAHGPSSR